MGTFLDSRDHSSTGFFDGHHEFLMLLFVRDFEDFLERLEITLQQDVQSAFQLVLQIVHCVPNFVTILATKQQPVFLFVELLKSLSVSQEGIKVSFSFDCLLEQGEFFWYESFESGLQSIVRKSIR